MKDGTLDIVWMGLDSRTCHQVIKGLELSTLSLWGEEKYCVWSTMASDYIKLPTSNP